MKYSFLAEQSLTHELMFGIMGVSLPWFVLILEVLGMEEVKDRDYYIKEITGLISGVHDLKFLEFVYRAVKRLKENWGV